MRLLHRYLYRRLAATTIVALVAVTTATAAFTAAAVRLSGAGAALPPRAFAGVVASLTLSRSDVILAITALAAALATFARLRARGEVVAMRCAGIGRRAILLPAAIAGVTLSVGLAVMQETVIRRAHAERRAIVRRHLGDGLDAVLRGGGALRDGRHACTWAYSGTDEDGYTVLRDVELTETSADGGARLVARARLAVPRFDAARGELTLTLRQLVHSTVLASESLEITLDVASLVDGAQPPPGIEERGAAALLAEARGGGSGEALAELSRRLAGLLAVALFPVFGATCGVTVARPVWLSLAVVTLPAAALCGGPAALDDAAGVTVWTGVVVAATITAAVWKRMGS